MLSLFDRDILHDVGFARYRLLDSEKISAAVRIYRFRVALQWLDHVLPRGCAHVEATAVILNHHCQSTFLLVKVREFKHLLTHLIGRLTNRRQGLDRLSDR